MPNLSRRDFVLTTAAAVLPARSTWTREQTLTAQAVVDRIRANGGVFAGKEPGDAFRAGDPSTPVTGIATTVMATMAVLQAAVARRQNLVLTLEPLFYAANDAPGPRANDPVYVAKKAFIDRERLVVVRVADPWATGPRTIQNSSAGALSQAMGWDGSFISQEGMRVTGVNSTFGGLVAAVRKRLAIQGGIRTVGRADMQVRSVFISPGTTDTARTIANLPAADVLICGEPREWEAVPYALDSWAAGQNKGLIALGRLVSEDPGIRTCSTWIKTFIKDVPVEHIPVADPYWSPAV